jgi:monothiol glutaredoxin
MDDSIRQQIEEAVKSNDVVLFMKGTPQAPRCGFSATVAGILDELVGDYKTIDVLADTGIREGIKQYSDWPTIPQLYVKGEFVGGCDIVREMYEKGELEQALGLEPQSVELPTINITAAAAEALSGVVEGDDEFVRLKIDSDYQHGLSVGPRQPRDLEVTSSGITVLVDRGSARRADGLKIDYTRGADGPAFRIENPNEPPRVKTIDVHELKAKLATGQPLELFDVREQKERDVAHIEGARLLDKDAQDHILALDPKTPLYFHCHHGGRSQKAAAFFLSKGFENVYNVTGGIDAWSLEIDPNVPRY